MYYEERIIGGLLHYRTTPKGRWIIYNYEELSNKVIELRKQLKKVREHRDALMDSSVEIDKVSLMINEHTTLGEITTFLNGE